MRRVIEILLACVVGWLFGGSLSSAGILITQPHFWVFLLLFALGWVILDAMKDLL